MADKTIAFKKPRSIRSGRDATEILFPYTVVDTSQIGLPEEQSETELYRIKVSISRTLKVVWLNKNEQLDIVKVLFEYGKRHVIQKMKDGALLENEELWLTTATHPSSCPFDSNRIPSPVGHTLTVSLGDEKMLENPTLLQLATAIIQTRDTINSVFKERFGGKLLIVKEERDTLQFFRDATSIEDFFYRVIALRNAIVNLNEPLLRKLTNNNNSEVKTISLLEIFLRTYSEYNESPIKIFRNINRLRQGYPIHGDTVNGVQEAHRFFGFDYPVTDYSNAWKHLLLNYLDSLQRIFEIIQPLR